MSLQDRAKATAKDITGKVQEGMGNMTGDINAQTEGKTKQAQAQASHMIEDIKHETKGVKEMPLTNNQTTVLAGNKRGAGVFSTHQEAENALKQLRDANFTMQQVSIIGKDTAPLDRNNHNDNIPDPDEDLTETTHVEEGAKTGAAAGSALGGLTGLLVGLGTLAIPGVGPIMLAGAAATAIATTLAGGAIGLAAGGLLGSLVGLGMPEEQARIYHDRVISGDYLVIVDGTETEILHAETILKTRGIREWKVYNTPTDAVSIDPATRY